MTEDELTIAEFARSLSKNDLIFEIIERMKQALAANNSGLLKVASILLAEWETRGLATSAVSDFKKLVDAALASVANKPVSARHEIL